MFEVFGVILSSISNAMYTYVLVALLIFAGIYFTIRTKGSQFRLLIESIKVMAEKPEDSNVSSVGAMVVTIASRVGTGNIIGITTAILTGGYGSVFWMWMIALVGASTSLIESTLAQIFKKKNQNGKYYGGPAYYIQFAMKGKKGLATAFTIALIATYGVGFNMLASYNLQSSFEIFPWYQKEITPWIIGFITAALVFYCLAGSGKRIVKITEFLVPIMGVGFILIALVITFMNIGNIGMVFERIFAEAFDFKAIFGAFAGSCLLMGIKRGLFSNEAGVGSAPNAAATAEVSHPVKQGLAQMLSVFIVTLLICSATAFMIMMTGLENTDNLNPAAYIQVCLAQNFGAIGPVLICVFLILFAFTTLIGNYYYVNSTLPFITKKKRASKWFYTVIHAIACIVILIGAGLESQMAWDIADILMGIMCLINIPIIIYLGKYAFRAIDDYVKQKKQGLNPVFKSENIGLQGKTDCWEA
ncbi:MAG: alanine:cation symporter family protein [Enterococcus sp.]|nr:alanine:cation symporter family protein [Enterococcus sp.]